MSTQYHFDDQIYTNKEEWKNAVSKDFYQKYNKYMIQAFFYVGRQFEYEGFTHEVLDNDAQISNTKGWLYLKTLGENSYKGWVHPRKILRKEPKLIQELDNSLEEKSIVIETFENQEQMQLF
ncbi:hypothetical protein [Bacillus pseudomycoides]|uniref:hypothetical protein n=1 Tax=Bacillus pseudomycoides TaxID=64104 RepID=UPI000BF1F935|nr:hypothetical protein [Bacillus pseudomycoides]PEM69352.1 hypothetical protein CN619_21705 [Bacillus pseudomycoides]PGA62176.1 hypothetical protein COL84_13450 [Bacillus pseudomycoides]